MCSLLFIASCLEVGPEPFGPGPTAFPQGEPAAESGDPPTRAARPGVVILSDSQAVDRRGRLIDITGLVAVRMIGKTRSWIVPLDSVEGGTESVLLELGGEGCDTGGEGGGGGGDGPHGGGGEQMVAGMQVLMFGGDTIDCCEGEYEEVIEGECQCPEYLIEDVELGCTCANLQDPDDYCHSEPWEYRFEIDAPCSSCVSVLDGMFACPIDCDVPDPPPGGGSGGNPPDTTVTLVCDTVVRGASGGCALTVEPETAQLTVQEWKFESEFVNPDPNTSGQHTWTGTLVASGQVLVNFTLNGEPDEAHFDLVVLPRDSTTWQWSPSNGITIQAGGISFPVDSSSSIGLVCRPGQPCPGPLHLVQPDSGSFSPGIGYTIGTVPSGPNEGASYVTGVSADISMASALNPDNLPDDPTSAKYSVSGAGVGQCTAGEYTFWHYNETCRQAPVPHYSVRISSNLSPCGVMTCEIDPGG